MIPYGQHEVTKEDILNVTSVLNSNHLTQGKMVPNFEDAINDVDTKEKNIPNKIKDINKKKINLSIFFHQS